MRKTPSTKDFGSCAPVRNMCAQARALAGALIPVDKAGTAVRITNKNDRLIQIDEKGIECTNCM